MKLPLSALLEHRACNLDERIESFKSHHGHDPNDESTFAQWAEVTPETRDLIWALRCIPDSRRICAEFSWRAGMRVLHIFESKSSSKAPRFALDLVRDWLDGKEASDMRIRWAANSASDAWSGGRSGSAAYGAAQASAHAANVAANVADSCSAAEDAAACAACCSAAYYYAAAADGDAASASTKERQLQRADLLELTA
jgi:hypothetical protein